jgi:hypothetical protein
VVRRAADREGVTTRRVPAILAALTLSATILTGAVSVAPAQAATREFVGNDVSWPQCPKGMGIPSRRSEGQPMPTTAGRFVVIGLTNGPGFSPNPCLASQVAFAEKRHLYTAAYAMTTHPTEDQVTTYGRKGPFRGSDRLTRLRNTGYAQAELNVTNLRAAGLTTPIIWIDVEPYRVRPWSKSITGNRAVIQGVRLAYEREGFRVGYYSTRYLWKGILGSQRSRLPEWRATGHGSKRNARAACSAGSFQGGAAAMGQWVYQNRDWNVVCPGFDSASQLRRYFHKY